MLDKEALEKEQLNENDLVEVWIKKYKPGEADG
jgi:hypothetical protein